MHLIINVNMPTAWQTTTERTDELHCADEMIDKVCRVRSHSPTTLMIGGDWNAHITKDTMEPPEYSVARCEERAEAIAHYLQERRSGT